MRTVLLTRDRERSAAFGRRLEAEAPGRFAPIVLPMSRIVPIFADVDLTGIGAVIFTSANGVRNFPLETGDGMVAYCVGDATARLARERGMQAHSAKGKAADLERLIRQMHPREAGALLHVRGVQIADDLAGRLAEDGWDMRQAIVYGQEPVTPGAADLEVMRHGVDMAVFFSPLAARRFAAEAGAHGWVLSRTVAVCISAACAQALTGLEFARVGLAGQPDAAGVLHEIFVSERWLAGLET